MEPLPIQKFQTRPWKFNRKRRRSGTDSVEIESKLLNCKIEKLFINTFINFKGDGKMLKKETGEGNTTLPVAISATNAETMDTESAK